MRVRIFQEIELDDALLLQHFGAERIKDPAFDYAVGSSLCAAVEATVRQLPAVRETKTCLVPKLLW